MGGRQAQPHRRDLGEVAALDHRIGELSRADHHRADLVGRHVGLREQLVQGRHDARGYVGRVVHLDPLDGPVAVHQHGVRVRPTYVDPNS